jgi:hypothetical protein
METFILFFILALPTLIDILVGFICFKFKKSRQTYLVSNLTIQVILFIILASTLGSLEYDIHGIVRLFTIILISGFIVSSSIINLFWVKNRNWKLARSLFLIPIILNFFWNWDYIDLKFTIIQIISLAYFILTVIDFRQLGNGKKELVEKAIDNEES